MTFHEKNGISGEYLYDIARFEPFVSWEAPGQNQWI